MLLQVDSVRRLIRRIYVLTLVLLLFNTVTIQLVRAHGLHVRSVSMHTLIVVPIFVLLQPLEKLRLTQRLLTVARITIAR